MQVVAFAKHPSVIGESEVFGQHHEELAAISILCEIFILTHHLMHYDYYQHYSPVPVGNGDAAKCMARIPRT